jgi:hypothetical protein
MYRLSNAFTIAFACALSSCAALDKPKRFLDKLDGADDINIKFEALSEAIGLGQTPTGTTPTTTCPVVCDDDTTDMGPIKTALTKLTRGVSKISALKQPLLKARQAQLKKPVSVETTVTTLTTAESHFAAIAKNAQEMKTATKFTEGPTIAVDMFAILQDVSAIGAGLMSNMTSAVRASETKTVGLVSSVILSVLALIQGVFLSIINIFISFLNAIAGQTASFTTNTTETTKLVDFLSSGSVFADVLSVLSTEKNAPALSAALTRARTPMAGLGGRLSSFLARAASSPNQVIVQSSRASVQGNTIDQILSLITGIITSILNLIVSIITSILNLIVGIIRAVISLIVGIIRAILDLIVSIINAILGLLSTRAGSKSGQKVLAKGEVDKDSPTLDVFFLLAFQSLLCIVGPNCLGSKQAKCQKEALTCQNNALSAAIPSV